MATVNGEPPAVTLERMGTPAPAPALAVLEGSKTRTDAVRADSKYTEAAKRELIEAIEAEAFQQFESVFEALKTAATKELDAAEGAARAALKDDPPALP